MTAARTHVEMEGTGIQWHGDSPRNPDGSPAYIHVGITHCENLLRKGLAIPVGPRAISFAEHVTADRWIVKAVSACGTYRETLRCICEAEARSFEQALALDGWIVSVRGPK